MATPFKKLLHRYHHNLATDEEKSLLMEMINSGKYDSEIGDQWEMLLSENLEAEPGSQAHSIDALKDVRDRIIPQEGSSPKNPRGRRLIYLVSAVAAVGLVLIMIGWWNRENKPTTGNTSDMAVETVEDKVYSGKQFVKLPDGSTVILNEESELRYATSFGENIREVFLSGEAFFDIVHNPDIPFMVRTGSINTRVLGTAFNVEAWPGESDIRVTVARGKVSVGNDQKVFEELIPNEQLAINTETEAFEKTKLDVEVATEWKRSFFVLDKVTMEDAAQMISNRYAVEVSIENTKLKNCLVNGAFLENESVEHIVSIVCLAMNAQYSIENDHIWIQGGVGCE